MKRLVVAALGAMGVHKGLELFRNTALLAKAAGSPVDFILIGYTPVPLGGEPFSVTGHYKPGELQSLLEKHLPDVIWFPVRWPETFSYTLSEAIRSGIAIVAPDLGALPERAVGMTNVRIHPWANGPEHMLRFFESLREESPARVAPRELAPPNASFYPALYTTSVHVRAKEPPIVTYETRNISGQYDPCAYIRIRLPLRHPACAPKQPLMPLSPSVPFDRDAAAVIVQRTAIGDLELAEYLVEQTRHRGIPLIFETDDDLFDIPLDHSEYDEYMKLLAPARIIAAAADAITTTSPVLAAKLQSINPNIVIVPNAADDRLWFGPETPREFVDDTIRILCMGTKTHKRDLELLEEPMARLYAKYGNRIRLEVIGMTDVAADWYDQVPFPVYCQESYPIFVQWIRDMRRRWAFAVAPLRKTPFNAGKSLVKFFDYSALGLPGIYSEGPPYDELRAVGAPAVFVTEDAESWVEAMTTLIEDLTLRKKLGTAASEFVRLRHTLAAQSATRRKTLSELLNLRTLVQSR